MTSKTILDEIVRWKHQEIERLKRLRPLEEIVNDAKPASSLPDLVRVLRAPGVSLIAEVKQASPSRGLLRADVDPAHLAATYAAHGASAVSVLTDRRYFQGKLEHLSAVKSALSHRQASIPILRKDFIVDPYQVHEARAAGADAILLIVAALQPGELDDLYRLTRNLGMSALVEVHDEDELDLALQIDPRVIGVNNRDLRTFEVSLDTTARLRPFVPDDVVLVSESGVHTRADVERLAAIGADAILVGEALVRADDVGRKVQELVR